MPGGRGTTVTCLVSQGNPAVVQYSRRAHESTGSGGGDNRYREQQTDYSTNTAISAIYIYCSKRYKVRKNSGTSTLYPKNKKRTFGKLEP